MVKGRIINQSFTFMAEEENKQEEVAPEAAPEATEESQAESTDESKAGDGKTE